MKRFTTMVNLKNKQVMVIDQARVRLRRMQKRIKNLADILNNHEVHKNYYMVMLTLTYKVAEDWRANDIRDFMLSLRKWAGKNLLGYAWVAEMQERGAVHYHVVCWFHKGTMVPEPDTVGWWCKGLTRRETVRSPFYLLKYTGKEHQKDFSKLPKGARVFAVWAGDKSLTMDLRFVSLKLWEQMYVKMDGWESLSFWRKHEKSLNGWMAWAFHGNENEAVADMKQWEQVLGVEK